MKKKVVAMFLAAVMALSLVACGSKTDNGGSGDASGTETIKLGGVGPHDENDGLPFYLNMKKEIPSSLNYDFWIENSFIVYIRRIMIALIEECLDGSKDSDYLNPKSIEDKLFSGIYDLTKDVELKDSDSLLEFLSDDNIRNIAKKWSLVL